jgi:GNAT superfamily N-acetyltransferase
MYDEQVARAAQTYDATPFSLRVATLEDTAPILELFDDAVAWMNSVGNTQQWGTTPYSGDPKRVAAVALWAGSGAAVVATRDGVSVGAMAVGEATPYAPPATEPELYVVALVARHHSGAGRVLLGLADAVARELGVQLLRVDCYAGGDQALVRFYESAGYTRADTFEVKGWPGQVLERRLR